MLNLRSFILLIHTLVWTHLGLAAAIVDPTGRLFSLFARAGWARQFLWIAGVRVTIRGAERIDWKQTYVVCANHQSQIDIPLLFACLPMGIRFLAKRSLFFIPVFGWALFLARFIPVNRADTAKARRSIERGALRIKRGPSLVVFPEGTRTLDGSIQYFKPGAFILAIKVGVPVLPVAIRGTYDVVPKTRLAVRPGPVELIVGEPISTAGLSMEDKEELRRQAQETVETLFRQAL